MIDVSDIALSLISMAIDKHPRKQFHHVNDVVPTIYDILNISPPRVANGFQQD